MPAAEPVVARSASPTRIAALPLATTYTIVPGAPLDPDPFASAGGLVVHPVRTVVVYASPGGSPVALLPTTELGSPTWVPVVQARSGWQRVLLPSRPDRTTGWISLGAGGLEHAVSAYRVHVELAAHRLTVTVEGRRPRAWTVAIGAASTPTPTGRTFLLASLTPAEPTYSPLILPLGTHSTTLDAFGGGPGTVALHGWPDPAIFGHDVSHGCVRVPAAALNALSQVPLGSLVTITA